MKALVLKFLEPKSTFHLLWSIQAPALELNVTWLQTSRNIVSILVLLLRYMTTSKFSVDCKFRRAIVYNCIKGLVLPAWLTLSLLYQSGMTLGLDGLDPSEESLSRARAMLPAAVGPHLRQLLEPPI